MFPNRTAFMALQAEVNPMIQDDVKDQVGGGDMLVWRRATLWRQKQRRQSLVVVNDLCQGLQSRR